MHWLQLASLLLSGCIFSLFSTPIFAVDYTQTPTYGFSIVDQGPGNHVAFFTYPKVAVDVSGNMYVADLSNQIQKFDSSGTFLTKWGSIGSGDGQFNYPYGVAVDNSGNVYVADTNNNRIQKFTFTGTFLTKWGSSGTGNGQFGSMMGEGPQGIFVDSSGSVYVTDFWNHRIQKFTSTGTYVTKWGSSGSGDGQFNYPNGVTVDNSGNVYVADKDNHRIQKFDSSGAFLTKWGSGGSGDGQFNYPYGVAVDSSGNVYVADSGHSRIQFFTNDYVAPALALDAFASPTSDSTPEIFGTATDTLSAIAGVEYQLDTTTGAWSECVAIDGGFDSMSEDFVCQVSPALTEASYTLYIRAVDAKSNQTADGDYTQITFTIGSDAQDIPSTRPITTTSRKRASEPAKPAVAILPSGLNAGGVVRPNKQGGDVSPNKVVLVLEPDSFPHAADLEVHSRSRAYIETQANPITISSNTTPFFLTLP